MANPLVDKLRDLANSRPALRRVREVVETANDLLGRPLPIGATPADAAPDAAASGAAAAQPAATPARAVPAQAPVLVYFDGKDHRTKAKVEELLRARDISFQVLDVANDEAERSWITGAAKSDEFPIVVVAGVPVGGLRELTQLDVNGELKRRVDGGA